MSGGLDYVRIGLVLPDPHNIRSQTGDISELTDSIRQQGILEPIIVQQHPVQRGAFLVKAGHRRLAAARAAGLQEVPVVIRHATGRDGSIITMLIENCQRLDLDPIDKAEAFGSLRERGYTVATIARATGLRASTISHYLTFLDLDESTKQRVRDGKVAAGDAVEAVRASRAIRRHQAGGSGKRRKAGPVSVDQVHFSYRHPLADQVRVMCELAGHAQPIGRDRAGQARFGCGACWEKAIRDDERARVETRQRLSADPVVVPFSDGSRRRA